MNWSTVRAKVLDVIGRSARVDTYWRDRERPFVRAEDSTRPDRGVQCLIQAFGVNTNMSENRLEHNGTTGKLDITQAEQGKFVVQCMVESSDQSDERQALEYTERIRSALRRSQVRAILRQANVTCSAVGDSIDLPVTVDDHVLSRASVDITFLFGANTSDPAAFGLEPLDYIETVEGTRDPAHPDDPVPIDAEFLT